MTFYPQYCEAAALASTVLLIMYFLKQNYRTTRNRLFLLLVVGNLVASILNILSAYAIVKPQEYSLRTLYLLNELYYAVYNYLAVILTMYVGVLVNSQKYRRFTRYLAVFVFCVQSILIFTTHITHFIFSFDENKIYSRNQGLTFLYLLAFICVIIANSAIVFFRKEFNRYQVVSATCFLMGIVLSIIIQTFNYEYLITNLTLAMVLFFVYSAFENPAYYLYGDTQCFNRRALLHTMRKKAKKGVGRTGKGGKSNPLS